MGRFTMAGLALSTLMLAAPMAQAAQVTNYAATNTYTCVVGEGTLGYQLDMLASTIDDGYLMGQLGKKDRDGMLLKVVSANGKSLQGKWGEALVALDQIVDKVDSLAAAAKPKIGADAAAAITAGALTAAQCMPAR